MTHTPSALTATAAVAASCLVASADAFAAPSFAPATLRAAHTALPLRSAAVSRTTTVPLSMSASPSSSSNNNNNNTSKKASLRASLGRIARGAVAGAALALSTALPRPAQAQEAATLSETDLAADEPVTLYEPIAIKKAVTLETFGAAAGAAGATIAGAYMYAVKKEKSVVDSEVDAFEAELERMEQFKQEFLDGVKSDRSLFASLNKAAKSKGVEEADADGAVSDDEFEKNVQAFMDEQQDKADKKKKPEWSVEKGGPALLERPDDIDGGKAEAWLEDIGFEDKPAEIDTKQLEALQRMFGGGSSDEGDEPVAK